MTDDAYNLSRLSVIQMQSLAERIFATEMLTRERFIDHCYRRRPLIALPCKKAALPQRDAHRVEVSSINAIDQRHVHFALARRFRLAIDPEEQIVLTLQR